MKNTNPRATPSLDAPAAYAGRREQILRQIETITKALDDHARRFEDAGGRNWAMVGDLGRISDGLADLARFLVLGR